MADAAPDTPPAAAPAGPVAVTPGGAPTGPPGAAPRPRWLRALYLPGLAAGGVSAACAVLLVLCVTLEALVSQMGLSTTLWQDLSVRLYGPLMLFGVVYAATRWCHVRMDLLRLRLGDRTRIGIELAGLLLLQAPIAICLTLWAWTPFVANLRRGESGPEGGLPALWLSRGVLPLAFALLLWISLAQLVELIWCWRRRQPMPEPATLATTAAASGDPAQADGGAAADPNHSYAGDLAGEWTASGPAGLMASAPRQQDLADDTAADAADADAAQRGDGS